MKNSLERSGQRIGQILSKILYPATVVASWIPTTFTGYIGELDFKKIAWREMYKQSYPCIWFERYPQRMNVKHIGKNSASAGVVHAPTNIEIDIGDNVRIAKGVWIIPAEPGTMDMAIAPSKLYIGNNVFLGLDAKILLKGGQELSICDEAIIGAGSIVTKSITEKGIYIGVPARLITKTYSE